MQRILNMFLDATVASLIMVPAFFCLNKLYFHNRKRMAGYILFAVYLSGMFAVAGLPDIRYVRFNPHCNLVPFAYMFSDLTNTLLNILLFIPLGVFLPVFWKRFLIAPRTVLFGFFISLLVESLQIFTYRATDINDLMTNTFGTFLGWTLAQIILKHFPGWTPGHRVREVYVICGISFSVMFFLHPFLADFLFSLFLRNK